MIFFFKSDGTLIKSAPETVYQGSAEAGKVYVVAPLNANMLVDVYYELPNGERWGAYLLENNGTVINNEEFPDGWALWSTTLESAITQYAGTLKAQFGFYQSGTADKVPLITSQGVTITIAKGVIRDLPSEPTADVYAQIVNAISSIKQDIANLPNEYLSNTNEDKIALKNNGAVEYSENATAGTIVKRDSNGKINVADGTEDLNAVNVRRLNEGLETKVTRVPIESGYYNLYGESHDGQISVPFAKDRSLGTIPQRTTTGQLKAADGVEDDDLATVKQLNAVQGNYTDITNIDLNTGDTTVEYDTELGIKVNAKGTLTHKNGATEQPTTKFEVPIIAGAGVSIEKKETEEKVEIKSLNSNIENGTGDVLIQTTDTNQSFKVMKDGRAKVKTAPKESTDVVRLEDIKNMSATIVDLGRSNSMTGDDYTKLENNENALLIYDGVIYRRSRGTNYGYDEMQFESIDDSVQTATIYITNCVVTAADEAAGVISVTDTSGLKVGMTIIFTTSGGSILAGISYRKIAYIDTENKKITMDGIVIDSDTLTDGSFIAVKANATSTNLTNCVVTTADEAAGVISVTNGKSLTVGMYIDFRASNGSILSGISNRKIIAKDIANNKITVSGTVIDSDTLTSGCYITLANDIGFNKIYNRVLRIWKQKPNSTTAYVRYAYIPIGGLPVTPSKATASATSGIFTDSELSKLQSNDNNYILFNNEIYRLADKDHSGTTGILSYTHTGLDGTDVMDKSINVNASTGAWTLVVGEGGKGWNTLTDVNLTVGNTTVQYDTTNGMQINSTARFTDSTGNHDATMDLDIPVVGTDGIVIDKASDSENIEISGKNFVQKGKDTTSRTWGSVYGYNGTGTGKPIVEKEFKVSGGIERNSLALRTTTGQLKVNDPREGNDATNKKYVDNGFVEKVTTSTQDHRLYGLRADGTQFIFPTSQNVPQHDNIAQYTTGDNIRTNTPIDNLDCANKKYVDDNIAALGKLYQHNYTFEAGTNNYVYCTTYKNSNTPMTAAEVINFFKSDPSVGKVVNVCVVNNGTTVGSGCFFDAGEGIDYTVIVLNSSADFIITADTNMTTNIIEL